MNTGKSSLLHCSAFEIFPDHTHVTMFPVNCSAKYWSRILCEKQQSDVTANGIYSHEGYGEYWIHNNTLLQRKHMCPTGFQYKINEFCMQLQLLTKQDDKLTSYMSFGKDWPNRNRKDGRCNTDVTLFHLVKRSGSSIEILYKFTDILEEFFAEGSDVYIMVERFIMRSISYFVMFGPSFYFWLPPPYYPSYFPCFSLREQTIAKKI